MRETVIVTAELSGGVGDYTRRLIEHLPCTSDLRLLIPKIRNRSTSSLEQYVVDETPNTARDLCNLLPHSGGSVLVQYSAYGYDRLGYPRWLIKGLQDWKRRSGGRLIVMFHEIWARWPIWNKNSVVQYLHRRDIGKLLRVTDLAFTATSSQARYLADLDARCPIEVLPVGSNIPLPGDTSMRRREPGLALLFGMQQARIRALRMMSADLRELAGVGRIRRIVTMGAGRTQHGDGEEEASLRELGLVEGFERRGPLPEKEISEILLTSEFAISVQDELSITKSGTFMAFATHGVNVLSCYADATKPEPISLITSAEELRIGVSVEELRSRAERLRRWHDRTSAWPVIADHVARALVHAGDSVARAR